MFITLIHHLAVLVVVLQQQRTHNTALRAHRQAPIYGNGTGINSVSGIYDETGYLSLPPCLWGPDAGARPSY